jgi:DNA-directed RNA polymerase specialized sigma24 family protein
MEQFHLEEEEMGDDSPEGMDYLSRQEIDAAISALTAKEELILLHGAELFCFINGFDSPDDLLQEALTRAVAGKRKCRRGLGIVPFLWGAMSSIANAAAKRSKRSRIDPFADPEDAEEEEELGAAGVELVDPERVVAAHDALQKLNALFKDDVEILILIDAMALGLKGEGLRTSLGLSQTDHDTIRKRMHRQCKDLAKPWRE